jgi:uncharacterized protein YhfF
LETGEVTRRRFRDVDEAFAYEEGEGDRSLQYWRRAHTNYFTPRREFSPNMRLFCERPSPIETLDCE